MNSDSRAAALPRLVPSSLLIVAAEITELVRARPDAAAADLVPRVAQLLEADFRLLRMGIILGQAASLLAPDPRHADLVHAMRNAEFILGEPTEIAAA